MAGSSYLLNEGRVRGGLHPQCPAKGGEHVSLDLRIRFVDGGDGLDALLDPEGPPGGFLHIRRANSVAEAPVAVMTCSISVRLVAPFQIRLWNLAWERGSLLRS